MQYKLPKVSVIILSYRNYEVIYDAINSTLNQDYNNIELIISNDNSDDFDIDELNNFFDGYRDKFPNISNVIINKNEKNLGTVKHVNKLVQMSSGEYFKLLAADDLFITDDAISQYVSYMENNDDAYFVVAQSAAYSNDLKQFLRYIPSDEQMKLLSTTTAQEQFHILAKDCIINAPAVFFARKYIDKFGYFDDKYFFADDWPAWISFTRNGNKIFVLDKPLVVYRFGGISNTNVYNADNIASLVLDEYFEIMRNESIAYSKQLGWKDTYTCRRLCMEYELSKNKYNLKTIIKNLDLYIINKANCVRKNNRLKWLLLLFCIALMSVCSIFANSINNSTILNAIIDLIYLMSELFLWVLALFYVVCFIVDFSK